MSCLIRPSIIDSSRTATDLEAQLNINLQDIRNSLFLHAQMVNQSVNCQLRMAVCGPPSWRFVPASTRIFELDIVDIVANYRNFPSGGRGLYDPQKGKIILCQDKWCRETLIHEALHSVSFTSCRQDIGRRYLNLFEGLTEFLTGYLMFRRYPNCYIAWKEGRYQKCSLTYIPLVKLWSAFCRFIPISELLKIHFWDGTQNWEAQYSNFLEAIHQAGYPNFGDFRRQPTPTAEARLLEECLRNFDRTQFRSIYEEAPLADALDFTQMIP